MDFFADLLAVFGRAHPMLLHMPIGMLVGLGLMELLGVKRGYAPISRWFIFIAAMSATLTAASGWVLHEESGYASSSGLEWHERLGIATAICANVCFLLRLVGATKYYRLVLLVTVGVMIPAGHFGAEMTHGKGFLFEPLEAKEVEEPVLPPPVAEENQVVTASFERNIAPLFKARCYKCHGPRKSKGDLRMDSVEAILAGGENGEIITFGAGIEHPVESVVLEETELYQRLLLPIEHDDHMPPESKTQLTSAEIDFLRLWLEAGAPFEGSFELADGVVVPVVPVAEPEAPREQKSSAPGDVQALRDHFVHVQPIEPGSNQLWVDFSAVAALTNDETVHQLLEPLSDSIVELSLARTLVTDLSIPLLRAMPNLMRLDLGQTLVTDQGLGDLSGHPKLQKLSLSQTQISEACLTSLQSFPALTHLWIWNTLIPASFMPQLREDLPQVTIEAGDLFNTSALETEANLVFSSEAPLVDAPPEVETTLGSVEVLESLTPINTACPVTGKAVDPQYSIVYEGRVIGFCCPNCPKTFWLDPAPYLSALPE